VHQLRNTYDAVVVGVGTVLADNPRLTVRGLRDASRNPVRVIIDSYLRTPLDAKVLSEPGKVIIATTKGVPLQRIEEFEDRGVEILAVGEYSNRVDLLVLAQELIKRDITSLLLECGGSLSASFLESGLVDKVLCFIAPKIIGGEGAITPVEGRGIRLMRDCLALQNTSVCKIGQDVLIEGYLKG
jgi:diaminohydroxyphosphoribosylaminopyrimidine deaminase/5-amino-6-(5-phosphoribosylamino)uracil reductase